MLPQFRTEPDLYQIPKLEIHREEHWFAGVYPDKRCARCVTAAPLREMFHATVATKLQRS